MLKRILVRLKLIPYDGPERRQVPRIKNHLRDLESSIDEEITEIIDRVSGRINKHPPGEKTS